jgi:phage-related minor tail protein
MASSDEEIVVRLRAQTDELNAGMAQASATVRASSDAMAESFRSATASFAQFDAIQKVNLKTAEQAAQAQAAINAVQQTGAFTAEELAAKQALVDAAMLKMGKDTEAAAVGLGMFTRNSRTMYSTSALFTDAMTGQFSRMRREVAALGNETGLMARAFRFAVSPAGLAAAAVGGLAFAAIEGAENASKLAGALQATGGALGVTGSQITALRDGLTDADTTVGEATSLVSKLALSGQFLGGELDNAARAAQAMAELTGESMDQAASAIESIARDPVKALQKLNSEFHFLTVPEAQEIANLLKVGDTAAAAAAAIRDLANAEGKRIQGAQQAQGFIGSWWSDFKGGLHSMEAAAESWGAPQTLQQQLGDVQGEIEKTANMFHATLSFKGGEHVSKAGFLDADAQDQMNRLLAQRKTLMEQINAENEKAAQTAKQTAATTKETNGLIAGAGKRGHSGGSGSADEQAFQQAQYAAQQQGHELSLAEQKAWWQKRLDADKAGGSADANATAAAMRHVVELQKQIDRQSEQSGREAARKRAQEAKQEAREEERSAKEAARAKLAADKQAADSAHDIASARITATLQGYKLEADAGQITAAQLLRGQITGLNEQLAADIRHYQRKAQLAAGDAAEQMKWNTAIVIDKEKTEAKMLALEKAYQTQIDRINHEIANSKMQYDRMMIDSGFREMNALIGQQETFKQAVLNVGLIVLERQEDNIAKGIAAALSGEDAKTAAVAAGGLERVAANAAAEAESLAVQGAAAVKWIMTEAAKAAASAFNALAGIPVVGPVLAVGASIAAFAAVAKLVSSVASAEGGWERVPADGMMTQLHKDEMVLPASVANPVRNMAKSGGGGGATNHYHFNIQAYDRRGLADFVARNGIELGNGLRRLGRNGHTL